MSRYEKSTAFLAWAARYDDGHHSHSLHSLRRHETWMKELGCPLIRLDSTHHSVEALLGQLMQVLSPESAR